MNLRHSQNQEGFIALISVIIIFAILLVLAALIAQSSFFTRFNVLDYENKKVSASLAEACVETALVNLAKDINYQPTNAAGDIVNVDSTKTCKICNPIIDSGTDKVIVTRAFYNKAYTNLQVKGDFFGGNFRVTLPGQYWDEVASNPAPSCSLP